MTTSTAVSGERELASYSSMFIQAAWGSFSFKWGGTCALRIVLPKRTLQIWGIDLRKLSAQGFAFWVAHFFFFFRGPCRKGRKSMDLVPPSSVPYLSFLSHTHTHFLFFSSLSTHSSLSVSKGTIKSLIKGPRHSLHRRGSCFVRNEKNKALGNN